MVLGEILETAPEEWKDWNVLWVDPEFAEPDNLNALIEKDGRYCWMDSSLGCQEGLGHSAIFYGKDDLTGFLSNFDRERNNDQWLSSPNKDNFKPFFNRINAIRQAIGLPPMKSFETFLSNIGVASDP